MGQRWTFRGSYVHTTSVESEMYTLPEREREREREREATGRTDVESDVTKYVCSTSRLSDHRVNILVRHARDNDLVH